MREKIYTIPVNEAFDKKDGCPICALYKMLEKNELELILGASMMERDVRARTDEQGFCQKHLETMLTMPNKLPLALIFDTHLGSIEKRLFDKKSSPKSNDVLKIAQDCYICNRLEGYMTQIYDTIFYLYKHESDFRRKTEEQPFFCLSHYAELLTRGAKTLDKKTFADFAQALRNVEGNYFSNLHDDVKWFVKKFDYRFIDEPWGNAKDSLERTVKALS